LVLLGIVLFFALEKFSPGGTVTLEGVMRVPSPISTLSEMG
jgi:hypothetical protein